MPHAGQAGGGYRALAQLGPRCAMESGAQPPVARRLRCDLAELVDTFDDVSWEMSVYLDLNTREVIHITPDVREELEAICAELPEEQTDEEACKAAFAS